MAKLDKLLKLLKERNASDLHLSAGLVPRMRVQGEMETVEGWAALDDEALRELMQEITSEARWKKFEKEWDLDFAYGLAGVARFRVNFLMQDRGVAAVCRIIPEDIQSLDDLGVPAAVAALAEIEKGLVLLTGPTGSGKSTTLAAIIDSINRNHERHIVTIEEPVEFVHKNRKSVISHREVGTHTNSFAAALRAVIRQDADVVLVGEMRDLETIAMAVTAAEMGLLVFGTLHTTSAVSTVDRMIDQFPVDQQEQIRAMLATSLKAVVAQVLCKKIGGGRIAALEVLIVNSAVSNLIREAKTFQIPSIMQVGGKVGMRLLNDSLLELVTNNLVEPMEAYIKSVNKEDLVAKLKGAGFQIDPSKLSEGGGDAGGGAPSPPPKPAAPAPAAPATPAPAAPAPAASQKTKSRLRIN